MASLKLYLVAFVVGLVVLDAMVQAKNLSPPPSPNRGASGSAPGGGNGAPASGNGAPAGGNNGFPPGFNPAARRGGVSGAPGGGPPLQG